MNSETKKYMPKQEQDKEHTKSYQELLSSLEMPELNKGLNYQVENYLTAIQRLNRERGDVKNKEETRELAMFCFKLTQFIFSRDHRIDEIKSKEVQEAIETKSELFPYGIPKLMLCVDGRVLSKLFAGLHGNALRTPAGDSEEFMPKRKSKGLFLKESLKGSRLLNMETS